MSQSTPVLVEPLTLGETMPRGAWFSRKVLVFSSMLVGLVFAAFLSLTPATPDEVDEPDITMFGAQVAQPSLATLVAPHGALVSPRVGLRPQFRADASRGSFVQPSGALTSPLSTSCPRPGMPVSVSAMQDSLKKYNIPSSPMTRFALTTLAATRDVSMAAQAKEEFSRLDPVTQAKFKKLARDVVVKAETLKPEDMAGAIAPFGFWDPFGFSKTWDIAGLRAVELKHGRVCMLATLGMIVSEKFHPIFDAWGDGEFVSAAASHFTPTAGLNFWPAFVTMIGGLDLFADFTQPLDAAPGDFGFDPLGLKPTKPSELLELQNKELSNGRLAMLAAAGILSQELVTGKRIF